MKKRLLVLLMAFAMLAMAGCNSTPAGDDNNGGEDVETVTITHNYGTAEVPLNPEKVLVMDYGILDIFQEMDLPVGGLPKGQSMPAYLDKYNGDAYLGAGSLKEADFEAINEYAPELIIISGRLSSSYDELSAIAPTVYVATSDANYMQAFAKNVDVLVKIFPDKAGEIQARYNEIIGAVTALKADAQASGYEAMVLMANDGNLSTFGTDSRYGLVYNDFGFTMADEEGVIATAHGNEVSFEYIAEVDADVIFVIDRSAAIGTEGATGAQTLLDNDLVNGTRAAQNGKIIYLSSDVWYVATGGFHGTQTMVAEVATALQD